MRTSTTGGKSRVGRVQLVNALPSDTKNLGDFSSADEFGDAGLGQATALLNDGHGLDCHGVHDPGSALLESVRQEVKAMAGSVQEVVIREGKRDRQLVMKSRNGRAMRRKRVEDVVEDVAHIDVSDDVKGDGPVLHCFPFQMKPLLRSCEIRLGSQRLPLGVPGSTTDRLLVSAGYEIA
jgi:hypothetical protein